jgi:hypothetical protein
VLIAQQYSKQKLDTAIAILVVIEDSASRDLVDGRDGNGNGNGMAALRSLGRSYLKQVLETNYFVRSRASSKEKGKKDLSDSAAAAVTALEAEISLVFTRHSLLDALYAARVLSRGGLEDSTDDFRSMQLVVPHVYIGSVYPSECRTTLQAAGITHICNCCNGWEPSFPSEFSYLHVPVEDEATQDLTGYFIDCIAFIDVAIQMNNSDGASNEKQNKKQATKHNTIDGKKKPHHSSTSARNQSQSQTSEGSSSSSESSNNNNNDNNNNNNNNNVYIHCQLGISRSAAIVVAYLMFTLQLPYQAASAVLKRARPFVCPNEGFVEQLRRFEASLRL